MRHRVNARDVGRREKRPNHLRPFLCHLHRLDGQEGSVTGLAASAAGPTFARRCSIGRDRNEIKRRCRGPCSLPSSWRIVHCSVAAVLSQFSSGCFLSTIFKTFFLFILLTWQSFVSRKSLFFFLTNGLKEKRRSVDRKAAENKKALGYKLCYVVYI